MKSRIIGCSVISLSLLACSSHGNVSNINGSSRKSAETESQSNRPCVNLSTATAAELVPLEGIGETIAQRVVDYRERNGRFRRKQDLLIIEGLSEKKYRAIEAKVCVE